GGTGPPAPPNGQPSQSICAPRPVAHWLCAPSAPAKGSGLRDAFPAKNSRERDSDLSSDTGFWSCPWCWQFFQRRGCVGSASHSPICELVVIICKPQHRGRSLRVSHPVGQCSHFGGAVAPVVHIIHVICGHSTNSCGPE